MSVRKQGKAHTVAMGGSHTRFSGRSHVWRMRGVKKLLTRHVGMR
jgi:hypothetical protein